MKIGILTFHRAENFGATLQVYALQEVLSSMGAHAEIIDYRCFRIEKSYKLLVFPDFFARKNIFKTFKKFLYHIFSIRHRLKKKEKYVTFWNNYLKLSDKPIYSKNEIPLDYDIYISGSDQVFNFNISGNDTTFFCNFNAKQESTKLSYAASLESYCFKHIAKNQKLFSSLLENFDFISVREKIVAQKLQPLVNKKIEVVLDPTFLLPNSKFKEISNSILDNNYVLVYHLRWTKESIEIAKKISKKRNLKIIQIHAGHNPFLREKTHKQNLGPKELLSYIINADFIITTSFHGTALSLKFEKQFLVLSLGSHMRQKELLSELGIQDRLVNGTENFDKMNDIDYETVNKKLKLLQNKSFEFLKNSLNIRLVNRKNTL